jgi:hypothetical protein
VQGDVISLVALDFVLRVLLARMVDIAFVVYIFGMHPDDPAAHAPGLGIPTDVIVHFEFSGHGRNPGKRV